MYPLAAGQTPAPRRRPQRRAKGRHDDHDTPEEKAPVGAGVSRDRRGRRRDLRGAPHGLSSAGPHERRDPHGGGALPAPPLGLPGKLRRVFVKGEARRSDKFGIGQSPDEDFAQAVLHEVFVAISRSPAWIAGRSAVRRCAVWSAWARQRERRGGPTYAASERTPPGTVMNRWLNLPGARPRGAREVAHSRAFRAHHGCGRTVDRSARTPRMVACDAGESTRALTAGASRSSVPIASCGASALTR